MKCARCGIETLITTMSRFNLDVCCMRCIELEKQHPEYEKAAETEFQQVKAGNYNFSGVGLPVGYNDWVSARGEEK